jgi:methionine biosynthesis protein MetW
MKLLEKYKIDLIVESRSIYKDAILSLLDEDKRASLLDMGCGDGKLTHRLAAKIGTKNITGVDVSSSIVSTPGAVRMVQEDLNHPPISALATAGYDVVVASQVIEHAWNTDGLAKEIYRVLKPTGYLVLSTPNLAAWHNILYLTRGRQPETATVSDILYSWKETPGHMRIFTATELIVFLSFHGFRIEALVPTSYYPLKGYLSRRMAFIDWKHAGMITVKARKK